MEYQDLRLYSGKIMDKKNTQYYFPREYKTVNKFLGIIEYRVVIVICAYLYILYNIIGIFNFSIVIKIYVYIMCALPVISFLIVKINNENILDLLLIYLKYIFKPKRYFFVINDLNTSVRRKIKKMSSISRGINKFFVL